MKKKFISIFCLCFLAASCDLFGAPQAAGVLKTVNGGVDWQFSNAIKDSTSTLTGVKVSRLVIDPKKRETVYLASYNSGVYRSEDFGQSWSKILSKIQVHDFVLDPVDAEVMYASGVFGGFGKVLKSKDKGKTWNEVYNEQGENSPVRALALNPLNPGQILAGTTSGNLVLSLDAGQTWKLMHNFDDQIQRIVWQPSRVLVLTKKKGLFSGNSIAENFQNLTTQLTKSVDFSSLSYNQEAVSSFNQFYADDISQNLLYLTTDRGLYKSTDSGSLWKFIPLPVKQEDSEAWAVTVPKSSSSIVYVSVGLTIYKSLDGGASFQTQSLPATGSVNAIAVDPELPQTAYAGIYFQE